MTAVIGTPVKRTLRVASLPASADKGQSVVLDGDGHLYTWDGSAWVDNGAAGGGGGGVTAYDVRKAIFYAPG